MHHRVDRGVGGHRLPLARQVDPGRDADAGCGQLLARVPEGEERRQREAPTCGVAGDNDGGGWDALAPEPAIGRHGIVDGGRAAVLRRQPVVDAQGAGSARPGDPRHEFSVRGDGADDVAAAMQVEDTDARVGAVDRGPLRRDSARVHRLQTDVVGDRPSERLHARALLLERRILRARSVLHHLEDALQFRAGHCYHLHK